LWDDGFLGRDTVVNVEILQFDDRDAIPVGGGGSEFTTIQSGVNAAGAADGDIVLVAAGVYAEQASVTNKVMTIKGEGAATRIVAPLTLVANLVDPFLAQRGEEARFLVVKLSKRRTFAACNVLAR
jgi:pectin methylesterase-like acyl-CoA thioesterase